ncbi:CRISPR-associated helicase/endonuclease Cas3 [Heyndrickxia coagulans]|uniref:CRISPR-associated helicase/endonuclease Cas3 n=1 Tax=Heyndrickxia coagulans TaxID=1398 RepID=UPI00036F3088|nr:CRISPR-associated helicase/endonuclease Cas3 [Heyndrickxia coagulans]
MPVLIPFDECIARPDEGEKKYYLKDHLLHVKKFAENWIVDAGETIKTLTGLAAVCHDIAKSHADWQRYIADPKVKKGPTHAPQGAFLFSFFGYHWLKSVGKWETNRVAWLWLVRDIADHHGRLKKLQDDHWLQRYDWEKMDMTGIARFLKDLYSEFSNLEITIDNLDSWLDTADEWIEEAMDDLDIGFRQKEEFDLMMQLQTWRSLTTSLIAGDRFDVKDTGTRLLDEITIEKCDAALGCYCTAKAGSPLAQARSQAQQNILKQLVEQPESYFYTLEMPTGYGKTITALKLAIWLGKQRHYRKIVYVAPYLSILEQTSRVIEEAMDIGALEHHSLAILDQYNKSGTQGEQRVPNDELAMESWAHSVICTSFQQWSKAIFPVRAQDVLRRAFLKDSIVIIDEPQIFNPDGWNLFLTGLEAIAKQQRLCILFLSATMPPFEYGLKKAPVRLVVSGNQVDRYQVQLKEKMDEEEMAAFLNTREDIKQAAILNTIEDAYRVYEQIKDEGDVRLLHGLMVPVHKKMEIAKIQDNLEKEKEKSLKVISTQIIEAGVDVSFHHVVRALPILPSIVQAAGRVNRHFEADNGILTIAPFFRNGEKNTRNSIYARPLQRITDKLLSEKNIWMESEMEPLVRKYYDEMFRENTYETAKQAIREAYEGDWPQLSKYEPFGQDYLKLPLFVPWEVPEEDEKWLPEQFLWLCKKFGVADAASIYERYSNVNFMNDLSFEERKQFMILFHHFVLNVPVKTALKFINREEYLQSNRVPLLYSEGAYDQKLGLVGHFDELDNFI